MNEDSRAKPERSWVANLKSLKKKKKKDIQKKKLIADPCETI